MSSIVEVTWLDSAHQEQVTVAGSVCYDADERETICRDCLCIPRQCVPKMEKIGAKDA